MHEHRRRFNPEVARLQEHARAVEPADRHDDRLGAVRGDQVALDIQRPQLSPNWRVDPNLAAQVSLADTNLNASGIKLNVNDQIRPLMDKMVEEQLAKIREQARNDPALEQTARREWAKMCRSIPLPAHMSMAGKHVPRSEE